MICAIHQPQFLPWLGYLHKMNTADVFVFLDNVQFKKNEFQNRNRVLTPNGAQWLTVPVSFRFGDTLRNVKLAENVPWRRKVWRSLEQNYARAPHFGEFAPGLYDVLQRDYANLAEVNTATALWLRACFGIVTPTLVCSDLPEFDAEPTRRLIDICRHVEADTYLAGAGGRDYMDIGLFERSGLRLVFQDFLHPEYPQCYSQHGFVSHLSAVDALFNCGGGEEARKPLNLDRANA
ncbi:MAG: WbqC family protein [Kiritimatiellae bacterium]|nr:WbqC family protein [Kiritimatiellia bacterium]